jgi:hypothetical protein
VVWITDVSPDLRIQTEWLDSFRRSSRHIPRALPVILSALITAIACGPASRPASQVAPPARSPLALTYLGVAGWQPGGRSSATARGCSPIHTCRAIPSLHSAIGDKHIAIIAPGLREHIHDYTCRLLHTLGDPPIVIATHFDQWRDAPVDVPPSAGDARFGDEVRACAPHTRLIIPHHFERMTFP